MKEETVLELVTGFLNHLGLSDKKGLSYNMSIGRAFGDTAELDIILCLHTTGTKIAISVDAIDGCPVCDEDEEKK